MTAPDPRAPSLRAAARCDMTTGEAEAYARGFADAREAAAKACEEAARVCREDHPKQWAAREGGIPAAWLQSWESSAEDAEECAARIRALRPAADRGEATGLEYRGG
jgi:hypothetical protein